MRIDKVKINGFKNLRGFEIELDNSKLNTVLLGQNAAGKSNFLEALVIIFRDLDLRVNPLFEFEIEYQCKTNNIRIVGNPTSSSGYEFFINNNDTSMPKAAFYRNKSEYLPRYVFSYYSGVSNRLEEHFDTHQRRFYKDLLDGKDDPMRHLFYARLIHSHFVLMAFYAFGNENIKKFLNEYLNITGLESVLFVLKRPDWFKGKPIKGGDPRFWYAKGVVKDFLSNLWDLSLAPIPSKEKVRLDFLHSPDQEQLYLYISNQEKLEQLATKYLTNANFFKMLESTYISDLIQEVRIKVQKKNVDGHVTFKELSEGEQQLLTVLGLLRFTKEEESLMLLDEPDTHLNPLWKWNYMSLLEKIVNEDNSSQIIMTTHDPLVIGGLTKEEIRIFYSDEVTKQIKATEPDFDPKGLGVAGILTSDFFGLPSTLDRETFNLLNRRNDLIVKQDSLQLNNDEKVELNKIFQELAVLGINTTDRDPLFEKFLIAMSKIEDFRVENLNNDQRAKQNTLAQEILATIIKEEKDDLH
ncbi:AAA family ATPase [Pedobacter caeni]|uniref:Predicted ATP-binding protein involved in virulence n=1 Tax=Pedobacter caeni TaxID=288992 RepID=A0A1M5KUH7_9SPHI|nr:ATP-binding protein [Pedobacter caeni]SHG56502.1 Predicted ATP-binding protein involved in virulence [Pedobacter caeni]